MMVNAQDVTDAPRELRENARELTRIFQEWAADGKGGCVLLSAPLDRGRSLLWRSLLRSVAAKQKKLPAPIIVDAGKSLRSVEDAHRLVSHAANMSKDSRRALLVACQVLLKKSNFAPLLVELLVRLATHAPPIADMLTKQAASPPPLDMQATLDLLNKALDLLESAGAQCIVLENIERASRAELIHVLPRLHEMSTRRAAPDGTLILVTYGREVHLSRVAQQIIHEIEARDGTHRIDMAPINREHIIEHAGDMDDALADELLTLCDGSLRKFMKIWKELPKSDLIAKSPDGRWGLGKEAPDGIRTKLDEAVDAMLADEPIADHARRALLLAAQQAPVATPEVVAAALWSLGHRLATARPKHDAEILRLFEKRFQPIMSALDGTGMTTRFSFRFPLLQMHLHLVLAADDQRDEFRRATAMALEDHSSRDDHDAAWRSISLYHEMHNAVGDARAAQLRTRIQAPPSPEGRRWEVPVVVAFMQQHLDLAAYLQWLLRFAWQNRYLYPYPDIAASLVAATPLAQSTDDPTLTFEIHLTAARIALLYSDFAAAKTATDAALTLADTSLGALEKGQALVVAGNIWIGQHQFETASSVLMEAMQLLDELQGDSPATAEAVAALGMSFAYRGDHDRAEELLNRALGIQQDLLGDDPATADTLNYLGLLHHMHDNLPMAESNYAYALTMRQKILGFHPDTAVSLNNLGSLYLDREDWEKAESFLRRALVTQVELLGDHPDSAVTLGNLAAMYMSRGKLDTAQECATRALSIQMASLGEHPLTAETLYLVGGILAAKGETKNAEASAWQGIRMLEGIDPLHPHVPVFLRSYAYLLRRMGRGVEGDNWDTLAEDRETAIARRIKHMD